LLATLQLLVPKAAVKRCVFSLLRKTFRLFALCSENIGG